MFRRQRDEFWYANRFGLSWPRLGAEGFEPAARAFERVLTASASPSPPPCNVTNVTPESVILPVGTQQQFTALGQNLDEVGWSTDPPGDPSSGSGQTFTTKWTVVGLGMQVTASCNQTLAVAFADVVGVKKVIIDGSDPEDEGPATICFGSSITLRAKPDPAGAMFPVGNPVWKITEKPEGSKLADPTAGSATAKITPDVPGTYKIQASCGTSSKTFILKALKVTFEPAGSVRTGWSEEKKFKIRTSVTVTVLPADRVTDVKIQFPGPPTPRRVKIFAKTVDKNAGTIKFDITGISATPADEPKGDAWIEAAVDGRVCAKLVTIVVVPKYIKKPFPQFETAKSPTENVALNRSTSPAMINVKPPRTVAGTFYGTRLSITIQDQFNKDLDDLYKGAPVREAFVQGNAGAPKIKGDRPINVTLDASGTYKDPIGQFVKQGFRVTGLNADQNIRVFVAGHSVDPIIRRHVRVTPPTNGTPAQLTITWPTPE